MTVVAALRVASTVRALPTSGPRTGEGGSAWIGNQQHLGRGRHAGPVEAQPAVAVVADELVAELRDELGRGLLAAVALERRPRCVCRQGP